MPASLCSHKIRGMKVEKNLLTINKFSRPGRKIDSVRGIVIHWTGNAGSTPVQNRNYFESLKDQAEPRKYASAHYIVGVYGSVLQCVPEDEVAYHAGSVFYRDGIEKRLGGYPNSHTIGIELCHPEADGVFTKETYDSAVELTAVLLKKYALNPQKDIYRHFDITGKICPKHFVNNPSAWKTFCSDVEKYLIGIR